MGCQSLGRLKPIVQNSFQHPNPLPQRNPGVDPGHVYADGSSESLLNSLQPNMHVHSERADDPGASFHVASMVQAMTSPPYLYPEVYARPGAQGIPGPLWELSNSTLDYEGGDDLCVVIYFKKSRTA